MKKILIILFLMLFNSCVFGYTTEEQLALQIVKNFENNQNLKDIQIAAASSINCYEVQQISENTDKKWFVDISKNTILRYTNYKEIDNYPKETKRVFSFNECVNNAITYLNSKNISLIDYAVDLELNDIQQQNYYLFFYKILNENLEIRSKNCIDVHVNVIDGNVSYFFREIKDDINIIEEPVLTDNEIRNIIYNLYGKKNITSLEIGGYGFTDNYDSIERFAFVNNDFIVAIDAYTHNIRNLYGSASCSKSNLSVNNEYYNKIKHIKNAVEFKTIKNKELTDEELSKIIVKNKDINFILCDTKSPKEIEYTDISTGFEIDKKDKGIARMEVNGKKYIFRKGSYWCFINNKTYNMGGNCIIKDGKLQLPEEFYKKVQTKDYDFFSKKTIDKVVLANSKSIHTELSFWQKIILWFKNLFA